MSDFTLPPRSTVIVGMTGSGKSTFALRALINILCACRFIFDDLGQASARLGIPHASTSHELEAALATRWVCFNPHKMFPGQLDQAFRFFCNWALAKSRLGPGHKILLVDEVWRFQSPHGIPQELAAVAQMGRAEDLELMTCTQLPHKLHASIIGGATEAVFFRLQESNALDKVTELDGQPETIKNLIPGRFVSVNRMNGWTLPGRVF